MNNGPNKGSKCVSVRYFGSEPAVTDYRLLGLTVRAPAHVDQYFTNRDLIRRVNDGQVTFEEEYQRKLAKIPIDQHTILV